MNQLSFHCNKKNYTAKRINNFYFQLIEPDLPSLYSIGDGTYLFTTPRLTKPFCNSCFSGRYFCFLNGVILGTTQTLETLDQKQWETLFNEKFFKLVEQTHNETQKNRDNEWTIVEIDSGATLFKGEIVSYDNCAFCFPLVIKEWGEKFKEDDSGLIADFKERASKKSSLLDQESFFNFLEHSFGFISYEHSFPGSGLEPDPLHGSYLTTVFSSFPPTSEKPPTLSLSGAQDKDQYRSRLKAFMEYCERSAFTTFRTNSPVFTKVNDPHFLATITLLQSSVFSSSHDYNFETYAVWAIDLLSKEKKLIPLSYVCDAEHYTRSSSSQKMDYPSTTSGFAAHVSQAAAIENALLELIERDSFLRWWKNPEKGIALSFPEAQSQVTQLLECAKQHLDNDELELKLILLPSPFELPSIMAFITSKNHTKAPAFIIGAAARFNVQEAVTSALNELSVGLLNCIARLYSHEDPFGTIPVTYDHIKTPQDHFYLFHDPRFIEKLPFHSYVLAQKEEIVSSERFSINSLATLQEAIKNKKMNAFVIDATPRWLRPFNIHVVRCGIMELLPLHFGYPLVISMEGASNYSPKNSVPHFFP